jgi:serine/threonine protein kinase
LKTPLVLFLTDGQPLPGPFRQFTCRVTQDSDEACRLARQLRPLALVVAARPELMPILISRLHDNTRQPIIALTPNEPREAIRAVRAGAYDAAIFGTLEQVLDAAIADGKRIQEGLPERLGPYEVHEMLGRGGMSTVFRATASGREVALKVLSAELAGNQEFVQRFEREARSAATLIHPHLMAVYGHGRARWRLWMAMELVRGKTLDSMLQHGGRFEPKRALALARQMTEALGYAHAKGFVHRDIKPNNIVIGDGDLVKVMDFGLLKATASDSTPITRSDEFVGTLLYAAPEQVGGEPCDGRADLYSLGVVLFEMLAGIRPFGSQDSMLIIRAKESGQLPFRVVELNPACPPPMAEIIERLMQPRPDQRYASAGELLAAIDEAAGKL